MTYKFNFYKLKIRSILTILNGKVKIELKIYFTYFKKLIRTDFQVIVKHILLSCIFSLEAIRSVL